MEQTLVILDELLKNAAKRLEEIAHLQQIYQKSLSILQKSSDLHNLDKIGQELNDIIGRDEFEGLRYADSKSNSYQSDAEGSEELIQSQFYHSKHAKKHCMSDISNTYLETDKVGHKNNSLMKTSTRSRFNAGDLEIKSKKNSYNYRDSSKRCNNLLNNKHLTRNMSIHEFMQ